MAGRHLLHDIFQPLVLTDIQIDYLVLEVIPLSSHDTARRMRINHEKESEKKIEMWTA